ncbi:MAG: hypothetical protein BZ138_05135 [Methanosphaera sp. rholeuAM270]|nr:MAG: hypothetical protein BZ138_05135 [Methanosphaera sp. rholeuAM270]
MIEILIAIAMGIMLGIITGLTPGLHVNTVGIIIFSISDKILELTTPIILASFFVSISLTHAMLEFIPSLLMGIPDEDTILSIQPGHRMLFKKEGRKAIRIVSFGGYLSIIFLVALMPLLMIILPIIYNILKEYIAYLLMITMTILLLHFNKKEKRAKSMLLFLISGVLGLTVLGSNIGNNIGLLCILSGLFSVSNLLYTMNNNSQIPPQSDEKTFLVDKSFKKATLAGSLSGCILGLLPGLGPAQGTVIAQSITLNKNITPEEFLITNSGVNISDTLFSLMAIYLINNPRSAISVYISNILTNIELVHIIFFIFISLITVSITCILSIKIGDYLIDHILTINYNKLNTIIILIITGILIIFSITNNSCLWYVLLCYATSIGLGLICNILDLSKSNLMGVLIVPSIITYMGLF